MNALIPVVYDELHRMARHYLRREGGDLTLQTTSLVHDAYLRLVDQRKGDWRSRMQFFAVAAAMMRRVLVDRARRRRALKRGGGLRPLPLDESRAPRAEGDVDLVALDEALKGLEAVDARQSRVVELRFFGGLSIEEAATVLGISTATVKREWAVAKAWLHHEMKGETHR